MISTNFILFVGLITCFGVILLYTDQLDSYSYWFLRRAQFIVLSLALLTLVMVGVNLIWFMYKIFH